jgi:alkylation response protein AidB-like acyl-CoA dehydrogenase
MNLQLSEEQALLEASVRSFLAAEYGWDKRQRSLQAPHACAPSQWRQFATLGWLGLRVPEALGGSGAGLLEAGLVQQGLGGHLVLEPYAASALVASPLLAGLADETQRQTWLPALLAGERRAALAHEEAAESSPFGARSCRASRSGAGWRLQGRKQLVPGAAGADLLLVSARVDEGHRLFLLQPGLPGLDIAPARCADGAWVADLAFEDLHLPASALLGGDQDLSRALQAALAGQLVLQCWEASGVMAALLAQTTAYVQQRRQFGQALAQFQVVQHRLAEMALCCEQAGAACELAALCIDAGAVDASALAAMAKSKVAREARYVAQNAVQLHGAMGVTEELPVASGFRKLTVFAQQGGSAAVHARAYGQELLRSAGWSHSRTLGAMEDA